MGSKALIAAVIALSLAGIGGASARHKRKIVRYYPPAVVYVPAAPFVAERPRPPWGAPQQCFVDQGYGRFWPCGAGPSGF
jgi:hypothetical protein